MPDAKQKDWHPADIQAELHKCGKTFSELAKANGYKSLASIRVAIDRPFPKAEAIIAAAIHKQPMEIWPSRYDSSGKSNRRAGAKPKNGMPLPE